jgi:hypothetical protein
VVLWADTTKWAPSVILQDGFRVNTGVLYGGFRRRSVVDVRGGPATRPTHAAGRRAG